MATLVLAESLQMADTSRTNWLHSALFCSAVTIPLATAQWVRLSLGNRPSKLVGWVLGLSTLGTLAGVFGHIDPGFVAVLALAVLVSLAVAAGLRDPASPLKRASRGDPSGEPSLSERAETERAGLQRGPSAPDGSERCAFGRGRPEMQGLSMSMITAEPEAVGLSSERLKRTAPVMESSSPTVWRLRPTALVRQCRPR